jgi:hypothetical protein
MSESAQQTEMALPHWPLTPRARPQHRNFPKPASALAEFATVLAHSPPIVGSITNVSQFPENPFVTRQRARRCCLPLQM